MAEPREFVQHRAKTSLRNGKHRAAAALLWLEGGAAETNEGARGLEISRRRASQACVEWPFLARPRRNPHKTRAFCEFGMVKSRENRLSVAGLLPCIGANSP
jgi:hypothetical protein